MGRGAETIATGIGTVAEHELFEFFEHDFLNIKKIFLLRDICPLPTTWHMSS